MRIVTLWLAATLLAPTLWAQSSPNRAARDRFLAVTAGYSDLGDESGFSVAGAIAWTKAKAFYYAIPVDVTIVPGESGDRYYMDTFSNGQSRCRDSATGQFASTSKCQATPTYRYAIAGEANYAWRGVDGSPFAGAGIRFGSRSTPYLTLGVIGKAPDVGSGYARISVGASFVQIGVGGHW